MKKKSIFFTLFIFLFGFAGSFLSLLPKDEKVASADTGLSNISVWDGTTPTTGGMDFVQDENDETLFHIYTAKGFAFLAFKINTKHEQMQEQTIHLETDIDLNLNNDRGWTPIGNDMYGFAGTFDGQGHSIYGLTELSASGAYAGLFGYVSGTIKNLHIKNANFTSNATYIGAIAGEAYGTILNCSVTGTISSTSSDSESCLGGIVGKNSGRKNPGTVKLCYSKAALTGKNVGGICGSSSAQIAQCASHSTITATLQAGGIAALSSGSISNCFNQGAINKGAVGSSDTAGGIVGKLLSGTINCCYNTAQITGANAGGLVGVVYGSGELSNSFSINHGTQNIAIKGSGGSLAFSHVYSDIKSQTGVITLPALAETNGISGISIAKTKGFYENPYYWADISSGDVANDWTSPWDFENVWKISPSENNGFPMLKHLYDGENPNNESTYTISNRLLGSGTYLDPYQIWTAGDLGWLSFHYNSSMQGKYFALQKNIDLSGKTWKPLYGGEQTNDEGKTITTSFEGVFDGNGYTISGLTSSTQITFTYYGLFGKTENAVIKNLVVDARYLIPQTEDSRAGVLIGEAGANTYIVNVVTLNDSILSIGYLSDNNVCFAYGELNEDYSKNITASSGILSTIYDVTLNTNGGIVYDKEINAYAGEPHILMDSSNDPISQTIDTSFAKNLPTSSPNYGENDIIVKVGYTFDSWDPTGISENQNNVFSAVCMYQGKQTFRVIYNGTNFIASNNREAHAYDFAGLQISSNDVYIPIEFYNDDFYGNFSTLFNSNSSCWVPTDGTKILRDGYFDIASFHTENDPDSTKIARNMFCSTSDIYAKWQGKSDKNYTITIKLESDPSDPYAKLSNVEIDRVIKSISINGDSEIVSYDEDDNQFTFNIPVTWVDEKGDQFNIKVNLRDGYEFDSTANGGEPDTTARMHEDKNFGFRTPSPQYTLLTSTNGQTFKNFADDYEITLYAKKSYQSIPTSISIGTIYALTPNITGYTEIQVNNDTLNFPTGAPAFGIDINGNGVFNESGYGITTRTVTNEYQVVYTFNDLPERYIRYVKNGNLFSMYECSVSGNTWTNDMLLAAFNYISPLGNPSGYTYYYTNANFGIIAQVADTTMQSFVEPQPTDLGADDANFKFIYTKEFEKSYTAVDYPNESAVKKAYRKFNTLEYTSSGAKIIFQEAITSVVLDVKFAYYGYDEELEELSYQDHYFDLKAISSDFGIELKGETESTIIDIGDTFSFSLALKNDAPNYANRRYKLYNQNSANLYNGENDYNFKLVGQSLTGFLMEYGTDPSSQKAVYSLKTAGATAGCYTLYIYLTDVLYQINYNAKYISSTNSSTFNDFAGATISRKGAQDKNSSGTISSLLYDETLNLKTELKQYEEGNENGCNKGNENSYVFAYWYIVETKEQISGTEWAFSRNRSDTLADLPIYSIYAVYKRKNITLEFSDRVLIQNYNGNYNSEDEDPPKVSNDGFVSLSFGENKVSSVSSADENWFKNFNGLTLTKTNNGLNLLGYQVVGASDEIIQDPLDDSDIKESNWGDIPHTINLQGAFERLRNAGSTSDEQTYYLMPIVSQKSISVTTYSGTGTSNFGDHNARGEVYNSAKVKTTNTTLQETKYYGTIIQVDLTYKLTEYDLYLNSTSVANQVLKNVYNSRTGYTKSAWKYTYSNPGNINSDPVVDSSIFKMTKDVFDNHSDLNLYLTWTPNNYTITLNQNNATKPGTTSISVTYDSPEIASIKTPERTGYVFGGWTVSQRGWSITETPSDIVIDTDGDFVAYADYTLLINEGDEEGDEENEQVIWYRPEDTTLYAYWIPKVLSVTLDANGGTQDYDTVYVVYDGGSIYSARTGATYPYAVSSEPITPTATRAGFNFLGYFKDDTQVITLEGTLLTYWTISETDGTELTAKWTYNNSYFGLSFENMIFDTLTFNGNNQTVELSQLLTIQNTSLSGFVIDFTKTYPIKMLVGENEDLNCTLTMSATRNTTQLVDVKSFIVKDAGEYNYTLSVNITDTIEGQTIWSQNYNFTILVERATLGISLDDSKTKNLKRLMTNFVSSSDLSTIFANFDATDVSNELKTFSGDTSLNDISLTQEEQDADITIADKILDYFTSKYYLMAHAYINYKTYKDWTYEDFATYKLANSEEIAEILENARLFDYFNYKNVSQTQQISSYDASFNLFANDYNPASTLSVSSLKILTNSSFSARESYRIRAYISGSDLSNYIYSLDEDENAYIDLVEPYNNLYLMPQILSLENQVAINQSYYDGHEKQIAWQGSRTSSEFNDIEIYRVKEDDENFFVGAKLFTSNAGDNTADTKKFTFVSQENYLYFREVNVLFYNPSDESYRDVTSMFTLVVPEDDSNTYQILGVSGINIITASAKMLTIENDNKVFSDIDELVYDEKFISLKSVTFETINGVKTTDFNSIVPGQQYAYEDVLIFEVLESTNYLISLRLSKQVKSVWLATEVIKFATDSMIFDNNYALYTWSSTEPSQFTGEMTTEGEYIFANVNDDQATSVQEYDVYAVYTDIVVASYDLNLPTFITNTFDTTTYIKRGVTTAQSITKPTQTGLQFSSLIATGNWGNIDYTQIFTGTGGTYIGQNLGVDYRDYFAPVYFKALWAVEDIDYIQILDSYSCQVNNFEGLYINDVVRITNLNNNFYTYTYSWYKQNPNTDKFVWISDSSKLTLPQNGAYEESGTYKLVIRADIISTLEQYLDSNVPFYSVTDADPENTTTPEQTIIFDLNFMRRKVISTTLPSGASAQVVYANKDYAPEIIIGYSYYAYIADLEDYSEEADYFETYAGGTSGITFEIKKDLASVDEIKNVGTYSIEIEFDETIFEVEAGVDKIFEFSVLPKEIDLADYSITFSKTLNATDPDLVKTLNVLVGLSSQEIVIEFTRESGELVGEYDLFVESISSEHPENYKLLKNDVVLYDDDTKAADASTTSVGTLTIAKTGALTLSWAVSAQDTAILTYDFSEGGYTYQIDSSRNFILKNGATTTKQIALSVFDATTNTAVSNAEILSMISSELSNSTFKFTKNTVDKTRTDDCGIYTFKVEGTTTLLNNFASVVFDSKHALHLTPKEISTSFAITKTFNNSKILNLTTQGAEISNISTWNDLYIEATYATEHVGTGISVSFMLKTKDTDKHTSNYTLSSQNSTGNITKLSAQFSATLTNSSYTYGEVSYDNIKAIVSSFALTAGADDVTSWASSGYYTISYSVDSATPKNSNGYLYKATNIDVLATTNFADFEITNASSNVVNVGHFDITSLNKTISIEAGHIDVWEGDTLAAQYNENYLVSQTNDSLTLTFNVGSLTSDDGTSKYYAISLDQTSFLSDSVVITATGDLSHGLLVYKKSSMVTLHVSDNTIFTDAYNGEEYTIEFNNTFDTIIVKNTTTTIGTSAVVYKDENDSVLSNTIVVSLAVQSNTQMKKVATYALSAAGTLTGYTGITFATQQTFTITPKTINVSNLSIEKTYNGYTSCQVESFAEKIAGDNVYITASFTDATAGQNKSVSLTLQGSDNNNYTLSANSATGTILKANAQIVLNKTSYTYGAIFNTTKDFTIQGPDGQLPLESDVNIKYVLASNETTDATYSALYYLDVGSLKLKIVSQTNPNYNFVEPNDTIVITPYQWNIVLTTAGVVTAEYGLSTLTFDKTLNSPLHEDVTLTMTRAAGDAVGYYAVVSAVVKNNSNYVLASIIDQSEGYYRITKPFENIYILASNELTIDASTMTTDQLVNALSFDIEYDGNTYDSIKLGGNSSDGYKFIIYNRANESIFREFVLNAYTFDGTTYTKLAGQIGGLSGTFALNRQLKNASGDTSNTFITSSNTSADNYNVGFGPYSVNASNSFFAKITPRQLYFKSDIVVESTNIPDAYLFTKEFTNKNAIYSYENADDIFERIVVGDIMGTTLTFKSGIEIAKYVGYGYTIESVLSGEGASNYHTNALTRIVGQGEEITLHDVFGRISKASMTLTINSQYFGYGEYTIDQEWINTNNYSNDHQVAYTYSTNLDMTNYDTNRINIILRANYNPATDFSSSNCLNVGDYGVYLSIITLDDFQITKYISDGSEYDTWDADNAEIRVVKKNLSLSNGAQTLTEIFTKKYDETTNAEIYDGSSLKFGVVGINPGDEFVIDSARYKSALPGASIEVQFTTSGADKDNYYLPVYPSGIINPIKVNLVFDYDRTTIHSNVDNNNLPTLAHLNFPFVSQTYLTSNSADIDTTAAKNFPTSLLVAGKSFTGWRLNFENVVENSTKHTYLTDLATLLGIEYTYEDEVFGFSVGNNYRTISLLNALIGQDTEDVCGMYYQDHDNQTITFSPVWSTNKYTIEISIENAAGQRSNAVGWVSLESDGVETIEINKITPATIGSIQVEYHKSVVITATPKAHCYFYGFSGQGGDYTITGENGEILTISNIQSNYTIHVQFSIINAEITYDLAGYPTAEFSSSSFTPKQNRKYVWTADYLSVENKTLDQTDLSNITLEGHNFVGIRKGVQEILLADFATTNLVDLLDDGVDLYSNPIAEATFTPMFEAKQIEVTLDYGYDDTTDTIQIEFNQKYVEAAGWDANPQARVGHTFAGWYLDAQFQTPITANTRVSNAEAHSVYAKWLKNKSTLTLNYAHATITDATIDFTQGDGYITASQVEFETPISFTITADEGYQIKHAEFDNIFDVSSTDGWQSAQVALTMPGSDFESTLPVDVLTNGVLLTLSNIKSVRAYDMSSGEIEIDIISNTFDVDTGKTIKIVATAEDGYVVSDEIVLMPETIEVSNLSMTETTLTFEISGIVGASEIQIYAYPRTNTLSFSFESDEFEDGKDALERIVIQQRTYAGTDLQNFTSIEAQTGQTLTGYLKLKEGYTFDETHSYSDDFEANFSVVSTGAYTGWIQVLISEINKDGETTISFGYDTFEISVEVIAYDASKNRVDGTDNHAYVNGTASTTAKYNSYVELTFEIAENYSFVYWTEDGTTELSKENNYSYKVQGDQTIYAIFSTFKYHIRFYAKEYTKLERESGAQREIYEDIATDFILPAGLTDSLDLYYGESTTIGVNTPNGYYYAGLTLKQDESFIYIDRVAKFDSIVEIFISSDSLSELNTPSNITLYAIFIAKEVSVQVNSYIDIDGTRLSNHVGELTLVSKTGENVNSYGYIDGTLIHYSPEYFVDGQPTSKTNFEVATNTNKDVYLKISNIEEGYRFLKLLCTNARAEVVQIKDGNIIYKITDIVGNDNEISVVVLFKPKLNNISITFESEGVLSRAGAFDVQTTQEFENRIFIDDTTSSRLVVSAYTDTSFTIQAFIKAGYYIDKNSQMLIDLQNIVPSSSISYTSLDINETGYTGVLTFDVTNYKGDYVIKILVQKSKYVVALQEGEETLAKIYNVSFGSLLNLSEENSANIEILDRRIYFEEEKLFVSIPKENCNFEGFFTYENGAGIRYIDSEGQAVRDWEESGYILNTITSKYELGPNVKFDEETGETTISIYIYWSYLKTRITFSVVPQIATNFTAEDLVKGVDATNSWFYAASPMYIEVSFNTDIHIVAPEIYGYSFYKFTINQKDINGTWLNPVVAYSNDIPWSTNDVDKIVECQIEIVYFAKVSVDIVGGQAGFTIEQSGSDEMARRLMQNGYVDTTKEFTIRANPSVGYEFLRWYDYSNSSSSFDPAYTTQTDRMMYMTLSVQGGSIDLIIPYFDQTYGKITTITSTSPTGDQQTYEIGVVDEGGHAIRGNNPPAGKNPIRVGDTIKLLVEAEYGFSILWNRIGITFEKYDQGISYFVMEIAPSMAGREVEVFPTFNSQILSVYFAFDFEEDEKDDMALDRNVASVAGSAWYDKKETKYFTIEKNKDIEFSLKTNSRYYISTLIINNYSNSYDILEKLDGENMILTKNYLAENEIVGTLQIVVKFSRRYWIKEDLTETELLGSGTLRDPYRISSEKELTLVMYLINNGAKNSHGKRYSICHYIVEKNLDLTNAFWTPIGTEENAFAGRFNFAGHTISGVAMATYFAPIEYNGLFGVVDPSARITLKNTSLWHVFLAVGLSLAVVVAVPTLTIIARKRRKRRQTLSTK